MAENLIINGVAYNKVEKVSFVDSSGNAVLYEKAQELLPTEYPDYVRTEAQRVASEVRKVLKTDSIVSICMSDTHYYANEGTSSSGLQNNEGCIHAAMAVKALTYLLPVDFVAHMGDVSWGASSTTPAVLKTQIEGFIDYLQEGRSSLPVFMAIGNHDPGIYYGADYLLDGQYLYDTFTAHSASDKTVFSGAANGGYCYRDFEDKKLRVFLLNTSENIITSGADTGTSATQQLWVAQALKNLNTKSNAADWSFIVLCHYPMDYGETRPLSKVFMQYVKGGSITLNGTTVNFSGANKARFICQHHGHVHNFLYGKLHALNGSTMEQYDAWRVGIPNVQYDRENYYGTYNGVSFAEATSYPKTVNSAKDTSFVVNVINKSEEKIYSFCYGAGYDRVIGYATTVYYSVTTTLTNATVSGGAASVEAKQPYTATLSATSGYELKTVKITMGGTDITSSAYSNGTINIASVTGNIVITATAEKKVLYINQLPISTDASGAVISATGYLENTYLGSSNGAEGYNWDFECTGFIPCKVGDIVRLKNIAFSKTTNNGANRLCFYNSSKEFIKMYNGGSTYDPQAVVDADGNWTQFTVPSTASGTAFFRMCCNGITTASIITVNQEIIDG